MPALARSDSRREEARERRRAERANRPRMRDGVGTVGGDLSGTVINSPSGPIHTGSGDLYAGPRFSGDGMGVQYLGGGSGAGGAPGSADR